jgi:tRNA A-37 threonylcarbamoyl transferase component Bud32
MTAPTPSEHSPHSHEGLSAAGLVVLLLEDQRRRWRGGERPRVEDYLDRHPHLAADADCVLQLLWGEFLLRQECGDTPTIEEYRARFPDHAEPLRCHLDHLAQLAAEALAPASEEATVYPTEPENVPLTRLPSTGPAPDLPRLLGEDVAVPGYEVLGVLGRGGMGVVYKARQPALQRVVALKMILHAEHAGEEERQRFRIEALAVARLQHPNIVQVYEVGECQGMEYFSIEYCPDGSLADKMVGRPWDPKEAAELLETLARAVHAAHQAQVVHRDLKPANILLAKGGIPKVTDFGLAKRLDVAGGLTQSNVILGTPEYMAPEQAGGRSRDIGPAADVYALGAIFYELLTGRPPFQGPTPLDTVLRVVADEVVSPRKVWAKTPRDLEAVCLKCLQKKPGERYRDCLDLAEDLRSYLDGEPVGVHRPGLTDQIRYWMRKQPIVAVGVAFFSMMLLLYLTSWSMPIVVLISWCVLPFGLAGGGRLVTSLALVGIVVTYVVFWDMGDSWRKESEAWFVGLMVFSFLFSFFSTYYILAARCVLWFYRGEFNEVLLKCLVGSILALAIGLLPVILLSALSDFLLKRFIDPQWHGALSVLTLGLLWLTCFVVGTWMGGKYRLKWRKR